MSNQLNTAWSAGFFEGEGHMTFVERKKGGQWLSLIIAQVNREPLDKFMTTFGLGKVYGPYGPYKANKQAYYQYAVYGKAAAVVAEEILPHLLNKGEQVKNALIKHERHVNDRA